MLVQKYSTWSAKQLGVAISTVAGRFCSEPVICQPSRFDASIWNILTHEDDPLLLPSIGKHTLLSSEPRLLDCLTDFYSESGFGLRKGLRRVLESEICAMLER